jgi:hypothetical protein
MSFGGGPSFVEDPQTAKIPKSRETKQAERELAKLDAQMDKLRRANDEKVTVRMMQALSPWGSFAGSVREDGEALHAQGGWFVRGSDIASAIATSLDAFRKLGDESSEDAELIKLSERRETVRQRREAARAKDLAKQHPVPTVVAPIK